MTQAHKNRIPLILLAAVAVLARAYYYFSIKTGGFLPKYPIFAHMLGTGLDPGERLLDVSPFYLAFFTLTGLSPAGAEVCQLGLGVFNCLLIYAIGKRLFPLFAAFSGALFYALYGNILVLEATLEPVVFVLFFNLLSVYFLVRAKEPGTPYIRAGLSGLFAGLSVSTKANFLLFLPLALAWLLFKPTNNRQPGGARLSALVFIVCAFVAILPVTARNHLKYKEFILVTADYGKVFFHGNAGSADGFRAQDLPFRPPEDNNPFPDTQHAVFRQTARDVAGPLSPGQAARFWVAHTLADIRGRPLTDFLARELTKLRLFFHDLEIHLTADGHRNYRAVFPLPLARWGLISSLGLLGMLLGLKRWKDYFPLYAPVLVYLASGLLLYVTSRYRAPAAPFLCLFAGFALYRIATSITHKRFKSFSLLFFALVGFLYLNNLGFEEKHLAHEKRMAAFLDLPRKMDRLLDQGNLRQEAGSFREAAFFFRAALLIHPYDPRARSGLARLSPNATLPAGGFPIEKDVNSLLADAKARSALKKAFIYGVRFWEKNGFETPLSLEALGKKGFLPGPEVELALVNPHAESLLITARHSGRNRVFAIGPDANIRIHAP